MVSGRISRFTPIPATPEMQSTAEDDPDWGLKFLESFPPTIRVKAAALHALWKKQGYGFKEPLKGLTEDDLTDMKFLKSDAKMIMGQLDLLFAPVGLPAFAPVAPVVPVIGRIRPSWNTKNMNPMESKDSSSSTGTREELHDFLSMLIVYCEQNDDTAGLAATKALGKYAEAPIGPGPALDAIDAAMDEHASRQLATAILKHIPKKLRELVDFEVGLQAGVFPILGALYYPHLGDDAVERQILEDTQLVTGTGTWQKGVDHRHELYAHLIKITAAVKRLTAHGQLPSDLNRRQGLQVAFSRLSFDREMEQFERDIRRDRKIWNTATVLEELKRHAQSWATGKADPKPQPQQIKQPQQNIQNPPGTKQLAKLAKAQSLALAAVAVTSGVPVTCYRWLTPGGCSNNKCYFQHPLTQKGASHLLPACADALKAGGVCPRLASGMPCFFKHGANALMGVGRVTVPTVYC